MALILEASLALVSLLVYLEFVFEESRPFGL